MNKYIQQQKKDKDKTTILQKLTYLILTETLRSIIRTRLLRRIYAVDLCDPPKAAGTTNPSLCECGRLILCDLIDDADDDDFKLLDDLLFRL